MTFIPDTRPVVKYMTSLGLLTREDLEDFWWPFLTDEAKADHAAGCRLWLIEQWADGARLIGPHASFADREYTERVEVVYRVPAWLMESVA